MKNKEQLIEEYKSLNESDNKDFISFYEQNIESIENVNSSDNEDENFRLRMYCEYAVSLIGDKKFDKGIGIIKKAISWFETALKKDNVEFKSVPLYRQLLWNLGSALYDTKDFNESKIIFKKLTFLYPENNMYKAWLKACNIAKFSKMRNIIWTPVLIWLIIEVLFSKKFSYEINRPFFILGTILVGLGFAFEIYIWINQLMLKRIRHNA